MQASEEETYSTSELLEDLQSCSANKVYIIADQSYSGFLAETLTTSDNHGNIAVFSSGGSSEYAWNDELTNYWVHANHTSQCTDQIYEVGIIIAKNESHIVVLFLIRQGAYKGYSSVIFCSKIIIIKNKIYTSTKRYAYSTSNQDVRRQNMNVNTRPYSQRDIKPRLTKYDFNIIFQLAIKSIRKSEN